MKMHRRGNWVLTLLLIVWVSLAQPVGAADSFVTIGYLPLSTRDEAMIIRGTAPRGSVVAVTVNGALKLRVAASSEMNVYRAPLGLEPGDNRIVVTLEGTAVQAEARIFRTTASFADLDDHWVRSDVEILATMSVINGMGDGTFGPDRPLTRAQFAKLLLLGLRLEPCAAPDHDFLDGATIAPWAQGYVSAAVARGLIRGYEDNTFRPESAVSRGEVAVMAARALRLMRAGGAGAAAEPLAGLPLAGLPFADREAIPAWVAPDLAQVMAAGLIDLRWWGESFRAGEAATRAEAAAVIRRLYTLP